MRKGAGARRPRRALAGAQAAGCVWAPSPAPPELVTWVAFMTPGAGWGSAAAPGLRRGACPSGRRGAAARAASAAAEGGGGRRRGARGRPGPRIGAAGGAIPARRPCGPLRPCGLCAGRAPAGERASEREKYKYGRPRQWEPRPRHFPPPGLRGADWLNVPARPPARRVPCVCAARRPPRLPARTRTLTRTHTLADPRRGSAAESLPFLLAASPFPTDCVRISYRSAPISAILGKLHKNKPSGLFLPEAGKCFGKRGGAGPARPSARGRVRAAGRAGSPRRRGDRPAPLQRRAGCGRGRVSGGGGGGGGSGGGGGRYGGRRWAAFPATCLRRPYPGEAKRGPRRGRRPPCAACVCLSGIMGFAHSRPGPGGPSSRRGGRAGGSRGRRGWGSGSAGAGASAARPASGRGGRGRQTCESERRGGRGRGHGRGQGATSVLVAETLITFREKGPDHLPPPPPFLGAARPLRDRERKFKSGRFPPRLARAGWGDPFVRLRSEEGGGDEPPSGVAQTRAPTPPFHGGTEVSVASVPLPPHRFLFLPLPADFLRGPKKRSLFPYATSSGAESSPFPLPASLGRLLNHLASSARKMH